jgi:ABC-type dipeptide transport system, periplasmic component
MQNGRKTSEKFIDAFDFLHEHIVPIIIVVIIAAGVLATTLIVKGKAAPVTESATDVSYVDMSTVYFAMDPVNSLNPLSSQDSDVYYISQLVYSSLFKVNANMGLVKDLVKSYDTNASEGSVSIVLRSNARFSDGSHLTAEDVRYTIHEINSIGSSSPYYEYANKIDSADVTGTYSLTIKFADPSDAALDNLVFPIVSSSSYSADSAAMDTGSGQYKYSSYDSTRYLKLIPNSRYYGNKAANSVVFRVVPMKSKVTGLMTMDYITAYVSRASGADADAEDKNLKDTEISSNRMEYLGFNFKNKFLAENTVRVAIAESLDTDQIIRDNYGGKGVSADSIYFPGFLGTENKGDAYPINQSDAIKRLEKAGFYDSNGDGVLEDTNTGDKLKLTLIVNSDDSSRVDTAQSVSDALEEEGFQIIIKKLSYSSYVSALKNGDFDLCIGGYQFDKKFDLRKLLAKNNYLSYNNSRAEKLADTLETSISVGAEKKAYEQLKTILTDELPYYCLCYKTYSFITVDKFESETVPTYFDIYRGCGSWKWQKARTADNESDTYSDSASGSD